MVSVSRQAASRQAAPLSVQVLLCWAVFSCLCVARASRSLQQNGFSSCVVIGTTNLRNCNNPSCNCQGKSSGKACYCRGQCDSSYKECDGNAKSNQANCDCAASPLGAAASQATNALKPVTAAASEIAAPITAPTPQQAPAPTPQQAPEAPVQTNPTGGVFQRATTPVYSIGGNNVASGGLPIGFSVGNGQAGFGTMGIPIIG